MELSDPEWSPFWMNYKFLKKKVKVREHETDSIGWRLNAPAEQANI